MMRLGERQRPRVERQTSATSQHSILIYESELQAMCRNALQFPDIETGGQAFGGFTGSGIPVVSLVTPPGPNAEHAGATFVQDASYLQKCREYLLLNHGVDCNGRYHSHHRLRLHHPSGGDVETATSQMRKTPCPAFVEIITNHDSAAGRVTVSPYLYFPDLLPRVYPAALAILPGISPQREAAFGSVVFPAQEACQWRLPMDRIDIEGLVMTGTVENNIPDAVRQQIDSLPEDVRARIQVEEDGDSIVVALPCKDGRLALSGFTMDSPDRPVAICISDKDGKDLEDVTKKINPYGLKLSLREVWRRLQDLPNRSGTTRIEKPKRVTPSPSLPSKPTKHRGSRKGNKVAKAKTPIKRKPSSPSARKACLKRRKKATKRIVQTKKSATSPSKNQQKRRQRK
jgi:hypothetical protein